MKRTQKAAKRGDAKCTFLREEYQRIRRQSQEFAVGSRFGNQVTIAQLETLGATVDELSEFVATSEEFSAQLKILSMKISSCDRGERLSSRQRLPVLDSARRRHIDQAKKAWERMGGGPEDAQLASISDRSNAIYDNEAKSFFNSDTIRADLDPDVTKDYPSLLSLIQESALSPEQKGVLTENSRHITYEEAGRLYNILKGIDPGGSLSYAYTLCDWVAERAKQADVAVQAEAAKLAKQAAMEKERVMNWVWVGLVVLVLALVILILSVNSMRYAKYKAIRDGRLLVPYWFGTKKLVLWEPGDAVILLRDKKLVAMTDAAGGYMSISAWASEEYKGRITYKSQMYKYKSDPIHSSDGVPVSVELAILWQIQNPNTYVSRIARDYHDERRHEGTPRGYNETMDPRGEQYYDQKLKETAETWIEMLAGSTLREHLCQLSAAKLISPYVQSYIDRYFQPSLDSASKFESRAPTVFKEAQAALNAKTNEYGIRIESLEVKKINLPQNLQQKLETVRLRFLEPARASAEAEAKMTEQRGLSTTQLEALRGLADIIGPDNVAKIEFLKAIGLAKIPFVAPQAPPFAVLQSVLTGQQPASGGYSTELPRNNTGSPSEIISSTEESKEERVNENPSEAKAPE